MRVNPTAIITHTYIVATSILLTMTAGLAWGLPLLVAGFLLAVIP